MHPQCDDAAARESPEADYIPPTLERAVGGMTAKVAGRGHRSRDLVNYLNDGK